MSSFGFDGGGGRAGFAGKCSENYLKLTFRMVSLSTQEENAFWRTGKFFVTNERKRVL